MASQSDAKEQFASILFEQLYLLVLFVIIVFTCCSDYLTYINSFVIGQSMHLLRICIVFLYITIVCLMFF